MLRGDVGVRFGGRGLYEMCVIYVVIIMIVVSRNRVQDHAFGGCAVRGARGGEHVEEAEGFAVLLRCGTERSAGAAGGEEWEDEVMCCRLRRVVGIEDGRVEGTGGEGSGWVVGVEGMGVFGAFAGCLQGGLVEGARALFWVGDGGGGGGFLGGVGKGFAKFLVDFVF